MNQEPERIDIHQIDLSGERGANSRHLFIELNDLFLRYAGKFSAERKNDDTGLWERQFSDYDVKIRWSAVQSIDLRLSEKNKCYIVELEVSGRVESISFFFKTKPEAISVRDKLDKYIFK